MKTKKNASIAYQPNFKCYHLHIIGFPTHGYSEWIAESLSDLKINTSTPLGTVQNIYECGVHQGSALSCTIANMVAWLSASAWISPVTLQPDTITGSSVPHKGYIPHILSPNESEHANPQQLNTHSFCDDAGRYLSSTDPLELIDRIQYNLTISGYMSIVNKLGVRADKSKIRIYNISPTVDIPPFHYTAWNHSCRTVNTKNIPKEIHFTDGTVSTTATNRNLGVHNSMDGSTQIRYNNKIPYIKLQRNRLLRLHVSHQLFPTLYSALVSSHAVFNPLAIATPLNKYLKDDIQFLPRLKKFYHLHPKDEAHPIFLSAMIGGHAFKSITKHIQVNSWSYQTVYHGTPSRPITHSLDPFYTPVPPLPPLRPSNQTASTKQPKSAPMLDSSSATHPLSSLTMLLTILPTSIGMNISRLEQQLITLHSHSPPKCLTTSLHQPTENS